MSERASDGILERIMATDCECSESARCDHCTMLSLFADDICRELIEWRKAKKYLRHERRCDKAYNCHFECNCGFDQLPEWMRA